MAEYITLANGNTIQYWERRGSPSESYSGSVGKAKRVFDVAWDDRLKFISGMLGWSEPVYYENGDFKHVKRVPPVAYPPILIPSNVPQVQGKSEANDYWLYACNVDSIEPIGIDRSRLEDRGAARTPDDLANENIMSTQDERGMHTYKYARVTVSFESLPYRVTSDADTIALGFVDVIDDPSQIDESWMWRYVSRTMQPHAEHLTLPFGVLKWGTGAGTLEGVIATNQVGKIISTVEVVYTWHQVPGIPEQAFSLIGCVNSSTIIDYSPGAGRRKEFAAGTLLFLGLELKTYRMSTGIFANDIVYRFKHFSARDPNTGALYSPEKGHNYFMAFNPSVAPGVAPYSYQKLVGNGSTHGVYQEADLSLLFTLPGLS